MIEYQKIFERSFLKHKDMTHSLPELPYSPDALAPAISAETIEFHYGKHFQTYIDNLNKMIEDSPYEVLAGKIEKAFGSAAGFKTEFIKAAATLFGSGWAWLCEDKDGALSIVQTQNADNPMTQGLKPLLTIDVWEHAYYIDYRNRRAAYLEAVWNLIDWNKVAGRL